MSADRDEGWMSRAVELATTAVGLTRPNPPVGAVVVKAGKVVGEGYHPRAGEPHAEVFALNAAGDKARGATLYVTLEPCSTTGRTPPCTEAIRAAGIVRVVYGCVDPNPVHAGQADQLLRSAGIDVTSGVLPAACDELIRPFATRITEKRPWVTLKLACSLDGRIADARGASKWITGPESREAVQALRRTADAILVGAGTLRADDPSLLPRPAQGRKPWRVVAAGAGPLPMKAKLFHDAFRSRTLVAMGKEHPSRVALEQRGVEILTLPARRGQVSIPALLKALARRDIMHVVCEGGGLMARSLLQAGCVDALWMFYAPLVLGGTARAGVGGNGWRLDLAPRFGIEDVVRYGDDVLIKARRRDV